MTILISACLLGEKCKYNGGHNLNDRVVQFVAGHEVIPVCPEVLGGLPCPRKPVEWQGERVVTRDGEDCSAQFRAGVEAVRRIIAGRHIDLAILQSRSPTCGVKQIYDGTFSGTRITGMGSLARMLSEIGVPLMDAEDVPEIH